MTEEVLAQARQEKLIGSIVDVYEAATEIGKICNAYQTEDVDFTVLLTHIGFEEDKKLAAQLDPALGLQYGWFTTDTVEKCHWVLTDKLKTPITGYENVAVTADPEDPTRCLVDFSFTVAHGLNQIYLTVHITV